MDEYGIETRAVEGENHGLYGEERDEAVKDAISESLAGRDFDAESRERMAESHTGNEIPERVRTKISAALDGRGKPPETRERMSESRRGEDNPAWKGGHVHRYGPGWKNARDSVRARDGVCRQCGHDGTERVLDVHHIIPVRHFRTANDVSLEDAHELDNLVLLCRSCHSDAEHGRIHFESGVGDPLSGNETQ